MSVWNLHQRVPCSILNKIECCYCIPLQYLAYVLLLSRTASPSLAVIAVTVKIQISLMTMIGQGDVEEVVWRRFYEQWTTDSDSAPQETPQNICRLAICHCELNRGQWPRVTFVDLYTNLNNYPHSSQSHHAKLRLLTISLKSCRRLFLLWRHNFVTWPDLTIFFFAKSCAKDAP